MSLIQTPWTSQPQQAVGIDWSNPITRGLVLAENLANPFVDDLGKTNTVVGTKVSASAVGMVTGFGSTNGVGTTDSIQTQLTTHSVQRSYFALALANGSGAGGNLGRILEKRVSGAQVELIFRDDSAGTSTFSRAWTSTGSWFFTNPPAGQWHKYLVRYDASSTANDPVIQVNGVQQTLTENLTPSGSLVNTSDAFVIGNRKNDNARNWSGQIALVLIWDRILNDNEARVINENPWQIFRPIPRRIFVPVAAGGNVTITGNIGDATASGLTASVTQSGSPVTISAGVGNSVAAGSQASIAQTFTVSAVTGNAASAGSQASVAQQYTLSAGIGNATAAGLTATITASGLTTISCTTGNAVAAGSQAVVNSAATVTCSVGNAAAAGLTAALDTAYTILANVGNATADGLSATIQAATGISCGVANAIAAGMTASITNNAPLTDSQKIDLILDILSNRQTLDPSTGVYTLYADDGVTVLKTAQAWEDAAGTIPYRGRALQRLDGMQ